MARFTSAKALSQRLILRNGETAILRQFTEGAPTDPAKPWRPGAAVAADHSAPMVFLPTGANDSYADGGRIHQAEIRILIAADDLTVVPTLKDRVIRGDESFSVVNVKKVNPNGERVIYTLLAVR